MLKPRVRKRTSEHSYSVPATLGPMGSGGGGFFSLAAFHAARLRGKVVYPGYDRLIEEVMTDWVTPGFREIVKKGEFRPINPMSKVLTENPKAIVDVSMFAVSTRQPDPYGGSIYYGNYTCFRRAIDVPNPGTLADESDVNAMLLDAKASLKGAGMDYLTTAAEFRETLGMFLNMKQNLLHRRDAAIKAWSKDLTQKRRTGKFRGFNSLKEGWEAFSNFWLEYRFGWRILAYDIQAIHDYYKRRHDGIVLFTRRSTQEFSESSTNHLATFRLDSGLGYGELWATTEQTETVRVGYSAFVDQAVLGNPIALNTLYDITPWTLVVDMFFNVQDNIIALSHFPIGVSEVADSGFVSSKRKVSVTPFVKFVPGTTALAEKEFTAQLQNVGMAESYARNKIGEPSFDISFQPNLDLGKIIDLATLALPIFRIIRKFLK